MEYTINRLAQLSGVSTRTLRYYDQIGLLAPLRKEDNGYRVYGENQVDRLQQILFYRELGLSLAGIADILDSPEFNRVQALSEHLQSLKQRKQQLETLIQTVEKSLKNEKGEIRMTDTEKFEGFKKQLIEDNETKYGEEIRGKYGNETVDASNKRISGMDEAAWTKYQDLTKQIEQLLAEAAGEGDPASEKAQQMCDLHRQWIEMTWPAGSYSKQAHAGLAEMYVGDPRFAEYYDRLVPGGASFLREALLVYCK
ncbi:MAG: MerR family transcriptional regulator [Eubacteriaceae bacterium]|jgi:DNA-binding transcriptional MerR regulator